jgi:hypothetical protein
MDVAYVVNALVITGLQAWVRPVKVVALQTRGSNPLYPLIDYMSLSLIWPLRNKGRYFNKE